jgi:mRNA-degrading endonuclease toxin of MazEF toxin-antitoxin module
MMSSWEIWTYDFPVEGPHPCVVFTNAARLAHPAFDRVNVLLCRTLRGPLQRDLSPVEIILDRADGLDRETLCRVDALHFVLKSGLREQRGVVGRERRRQICQRILQVFPFEF